MILIDYFMHLYLKWTHKRIDYNLYLKTSHWKRVSHKAIKRADYKCMLCNSRKYPLVVHHNNYDNLFWEKKSDLICVCNRCHKTIHYYIWNNIKKAG